MGLLRRILRGEERVPEWANVLTATQYRLFISTVQSEATGRGLQYTLGDGFLDVIGPGDQQWQFGLSNLVQMCAEVPDEDWAIVVRDHFDNLATSREGDRRLEEESHDFGRVRPLLKIRLFSDESLGGIGGGEFIQRKLAPGLVAVLCYDLPTAIGSVPREHAARWPLADGELFQLGLDNVRNLDPVDRLEHVFPGGAKHEVLTADHFFVTTHVLFLEAYLPPEAEFGAVVSVPNRNIVVFAPILDSSIVPAIGAMVPIAEELFHEGPGSISPHIYWWRGGNMSQVPARFDGKSVGLSPPEALGEIFDRLGASLK